MPEGDKWILLYKAEENLRESKRKSDEIINNMEERLEKKVRGLEEEISRLQADLKSEKERNGNLEEELRKCEAELNNVTNELDTLKGDQMRFIEDKDAHDRALQEQLKNNPLQLFLKVRPAPIPKPSLVKSTRPSPQKNKKSVGHPPTSSPERIAFTFDTNKAVGPEGTYTFLRVFHGEKGEEGTKEAAVWKSIEEHIENAFNRTHFIIIATGETNSGKTSTLWKGHKGGPKPLLEHIGELVFSSERKGWSISATWFEAYGDKLYTLLPRDKNTTDHPKTHSSSRASSQRASKAASMAISANQGSQRATSKQEPGITHFIPNKKQSAALPPGTYLHSRLGDYFYWKEADKAGYNYLKPTQISTLENFVDIKERALAKRHTAVTDGNEVSSRSNAVLELSLVDANRVVQGVITMVDLFGSEEATAGNSDSSERNLERGKATNHIGELDQYLKDISKGNVLERQTKPNGILLKLLLGGLEGLKLPEEAPASVARGKRTTVKVPRIAVLGHVIDSAEHVLANQRTINRMVEWGVLEEEHRS